MFQINFLEGCDTQIRRKKVSVNTSSKTGTLIDTQRTMAISIVVILYHLSQFLLSTLQRSKTVSHVSFVILENIGGRFITAD